MLYITLPDKRVRRLSFYLAMEEYVAKHVKADDCFFMWQVEPSVIFGRNQLIENEVNLEFCRKHNIQTYRRKSGSPQERRRLCVCRYEQRDVLIYHQRRAGGLYLQPLYQYGG